MGTEKRSYRVVKGEFYQNDPARPGQLKRFVVGDEILLGEDEAAAQAEGSFELVGSAPTPAPPAPADDDEG